MAVFEAQKLFCFLFARFDLTGGKDAEPKVKSIPPGEGVTSSSIDVTFLVVKAKSVCSDKMIPQMVARPVVAAVWTKKTWIVERSQVPKKLFLRRNKLETIIPSDVRGLKLLRLQTEFRRVHVGACSRRWPLPRPTTSGRSRGTAGLIRSELMSRPGRPERRQRKTSAKPFWVMLPRGNGCLPEIKNNKLEKVFH